MPTALVTGASSGIGRAFAARLATEGYDLVVVARDVSRLQALAAELAGTHGVVVDVLPADLATDTGSRAVADRVADPERPVDLLVANAGIGLNKAFGVSDVEDEDRMLRVNVLAVMRSAHAAVRAMSARRHGGIVLVASVSAFVPTGSYGATKSWVVALAENIHDQCARRGVSVVAVCPGYTHTEMFERSGVAEPAVPAALWNDPDQVVEVALRDLRRGRAVSVPGAPYKAIVATVRRTPALVVARGATNLGGRLRRRMPG